MEQDPVPARLAAVEVSAIRRKQLDPPPPDPVAAYGTTRPTPQWLTVIVGLAAILILERLMKSLLRGLVRQLSDS